MPLVNGKDISPDEAILLGLCPECGAMVTPRTALSHARSHWNPETLDPAGEARRRYNLLAEFAQTDRGISKSLDQHAPVASAPSSTVAQRHPILSKDNYYDLAALPFAFEAAAAFMHGDFARAILSSLIVIGIVYVVHNPENQFTTGFKKLTRSPLGAFGLLVFLLAYIAGPRVFAESAARLASLEPSVAPKIGEVNSVRNELTELKANRWPKLDDATIEGIAKDLAAVGKHNYELAFNNCVDCLEFVSGLRAALDKAGWTERDTHTLPPMIASIGGPPASGWAVNGFDDDQAMNAVRDAIKNNLHAEIPTGRYTAPAGEHFIGLRIGLKPFELQLSQTR